MNDIVERLRAAAKYQAPITNAEDRIPFDEPPINAEDFLWWKAADEIERLRATMAQAGTRLGYALNEHSGIFGVCRSCAELAWRELVQNPCPATDSQHAPNENKDLAK